MNLCIGEEGGWGIPGDLNNFFLFFNFGNLRG